MNTNWNDNNVIDVTHQQTNVLSKSFVSTVMTYMAHALLISGLVAYMFGSSEAFFSLLFNFETGSRTILGWIVLLAPLGLVFAIGAGIQRMSLTTLFIVFAAFAVFMGMSLSSIFVVYSLNSIVLTFGVTAGTFGAMALIGYFTKTDLTKLGSFLYMALIGLVIAMVVNWFMNSSTLDYVISAIGVLVFTGLTAYDMQKIKQIGLSADHESDSGRRLAILGALTLYLDFINLFLFLLRFFGGNRD
jgi:FtsH-binding integral membrane protein